MIFFLSFLVKLQTGLCVHFILYELSYFKYSINSVGKFTLLEMKMAILRNERIVFYKNKNN